MKKSGLGKKGRRKKRELGASKGEGTDGWMEDLKAPDQSNSLDYYVCYSLV